ncbi:pregnancy zone protein-like [Homarus americanus]|uniref:pregnancy zone protein-like n=1 Tax=Homarus americanus TaxID=6706 RepID=UPI001C495CB3|nr:pregnancy zone protein-like [Homarus americanus]
MNDLRLHKEDGCGLHDADQRSTSQTSSVWVTSLVIRALNEVSVNWPNMLYVDPQVTDKALKFLLAQQASHGAWWEPSGEVGDRKLVPSPYSLTGETTHDLNLSSTAHTMLSLLALRGLPSPLDEQVLAAITRGARWLEENLSLVGQASRPLEVSLVALALHLSESTFADLPIKYVYWGEDLVPLPSYRVESQRPHLQPRRSHAHDSGNVAATAYALRLYSIRGEIMTPSIVRWLQSQRCHDGGWMSTQDTLAAWEALYEFSGREGRARDTQLTVTVEPLHDHTQARTFYITPDNFLHLQSHQVNGKWGSMRVQGKGRGAAVLQLTSKYHVAEPHHLASPPTPAFHLRTRANWHGHNGSALTFITCVRWMFKEASDTSGISVLEVTVPTGYGASTEVLQEYVAAQTVPNLRRVDFQQRKITFFFEKLVGTDTCVEFSVERWFLPTSPRCYQ